MKSCLSHGAFDSRSSGPRSTLGWIHSVMFFGWTLKLLSRLSFSPKSKNEFRRLKYEEEEEEEEEEKGGAAME